MAGCGGIQTFPNTVRPGETVSIAMGWEKRFKKSNTTVTITASSGEIFTYNPDDPNVRAIINLYPDPVSWLVIGTESVRNDLSYGRSYGNAINSFFTDEDNDWWQTIAFIDLPLILPPGNTSIELINSYGDYSSSVVEIVGTQGAPTVFNAELNGPVSTKQLTSLERSPHYEILFESNEIPHAIEVLFQHETLAITGENGRMHIVNPRGNMKSVLWSDDLTQLKVILIPSGLYPLTNMKDFKFYIAGGIQGVVLQEVKAFDENGNDVSGISVLINENN